MYTRVYACVEEKTQEMCEKTCIKQSNNNAKVSITFTQFFSYVFHFIKIIHVLLTQFIHLKAKSEMYIM